MLYLLWFFAGIFASAAGYIAFAFWVEWRTDTRIKHTLPPVQQRWWPDDQPHPPKAG